MCLSATEAEAETAVVSAVERCGKINSSAQTQNLKAMLLADVVVRWWLLNCGSSYARDDTGARWGIWILQLRYHSVVRSYYYG